MVRLNIFQFGNDYRYNKLRVYYVISLILSGAVLVEAIVLFSPLLMLHLKVMVDRDPMLRPEPVTLTGTLRYNNDNPLGGGPGGSSTRTIL